MSTEKLIEILGLVLLVLFAATMFYQGTLILKGRRGYRHCERERYNTDAMRRRIEELLKDE